MIKKQNVQISEIFIIDFIWISVKSITTIDNNLNSCFLKLIIIQNILLVGIKMCVFQIHNNVKLQIAATFCISNLLWNKDDGESIPLQYD